MRNSILKSASKVALFAFVLLLGSSFASQALAATKDVSTASVGSQVGSLVYGTAGSVTFSVGATGSNGSGSVTWTVISGLPAGTLQSSTSAGGNSPWSGTLTINTTAATLPGVYSLTIEAGAGPGGTTATASGTLTIAPRPLTVSANANNKQYDGNVSATVVLSDNRVNSDDVTTSYTSASFSDAAVGNGKTVNVTGISITGGANASNYTLANTTTSDTADITPKTLTVSGLTAGNKTYDGNTTASVSGTPALVGIIGVEDVSVSGSATGSFGDKNVGVAKTVTVSGLSLAGADAGNYTLTQPSLSADINQAALSINGIGVSNKVYDATTSATVTGSPILSGVIGADAVVLGGSPVANFVDKNVANGKSVTISGYSVSGADAGNYSLAQPTGLSADITQATLTASATGVNKVYDNTTTAAVTMSSDAIGGDVVTLGYSASFADVNVGTLKPVSVTGISIIGGADAGNYVLANSSAGTTADITLRPVTVTADTQTKVYGQADPSLTYSITSGSLAVGDSFSGSLSRVAGEAVNSYAIGQNTLSLSANYTLTFNGANLTITPATLTVTADDKTIVYGDSDPLFTMSYSGFANGDTVLQLDTLPTAGVAGAHTNAASYAITASGGSDADYTFVYNPGTLTVSPKLITVTADPQTKVYGDADPTLTYVGDVLVGGDLYSGSLARVAGENVGAHAIQQGTVTAGSNYNIAFVPANLTVTARPITVTAVNDAKTYNGNNLSSATPAITSGLLQFSDTAGFTQSFDDKNVGTGKTLTATGIVNDGNGGANYSVTFGADTTGSITPRTLTATANASNKVYDGNTTATVSLSDDRLGGDLLTLSYASADFDTATAGTGKTVTVLGIAISGGADAGNYTLSSTTATDTADITPADQTITFAPLANKLETDADFTVSATSDSGLTVTFSASGDCTVTGNLVHLTSWGSCTITADQAGDVNYNPAPSVARSFDIAPTITLTPTTSSLPNATVGTAYSVTLNATSTNPADTFTWNVIGLPDWVTLTPAIDTLSATVSGTPTATSTSFNFTVDITGSNPMSVDSVSYNTLVYQAGFPPVSGGGGTSIVLGGGNNPAPSTPGAGVQTGGQTGGGQVLGATTFVFNTNLRLGMRNSDVMELQKELKKLGFFNAEPTGYFGPVTRAAVIAYQKSKGLPATGFFGPLTRAALNAYLALAI